MLQGNSLSEYRAFVTKWVRELEIKRAKGDAEKLEQIERTSDAYLLRKWLWLSSIVSAPIVYLLVPFILSCLHFFPAIVLDCLWILAKGLMGIVFALLITAIVMTVRGNFEEMR